MPWSLGVRGLIAILPVAGRTPPLRATKRNTLHAAFYAARRQRPMINTYRPIIATTPNAITYSIFVHLTSYSPYNQRRGDPSDHTDNRGSWDEDRHSLLS